MILCHKKYLKLNVDQNYCSMQRFPKLLIKIGLHDNVNCFDDFRNFDIRSEIQNKFIAFIAGNPN